jgi:hypothetical protein
MNHAQHLIIALAVLCVPVVHRWLPVDSDRAAGAQVYSCNNVGTNPSPCAQVGQFKCNSNYQVCKGKPESGCTTYCNDGTGGLSFQCQNDNQCQNHATAETHNCNPDGKCH